jgi:hypothetical protein
VVRRAIDAYDPEHVDGMDAPEMMELVASRLADALTATRRANRRVSAAMAALDRTKGAA